FIAAPFISVLAQPQLIEKVEPRADGLIIPYEKYKMPNGLTVIVHEDHSDPVATVMITYKVGSDRESIGKSGFAHFFEHMMFQGSKHVADEQHFKIVNEAGGNMNGNTTQDRTQYFNNIPSNQVEVALWLEADRMGYLLDSLTSKKFENQRDAVKNEKSQNQQNQPYGMIGEIMGQTLYPFKHPYSWPVIGYVDDLNRASLNDVKNFFLRWYGPNNAVLTIAGDVETKQILTWVEKYFGNIKQGPDVKRLKVPAVTLPSDKYASYRDKIYLPLSHRVIPTVPAYHRDEPALDCLADMMGDGNNSIFYRNFVKNEKAAGVDVYHPTHELSGEFTISILYYPPQEAFQDYTAYDKMFKEIEERTKATIDEFEKTGITEEALQRVKAKREATVLRGVESAYGKAEILSNWEWMLGRTFNVKDELERYNKVTKDDIVRVFNKYIKGAGAGVVNVYPRISDKDSVKSYNPNAGMELKDDPEYSGLAFTPLADTPERWTKPAPSTPKTAKVPDYYSSQLKNGLKIIGTKTSETPIVQIAMTIDGGDLTLSTDELKKNGIAELTAQLLNEGTKNYTTEQISAELDKLGSSINFTAGKTSSSVYITCLKKNLDATLKLLEEKLLNPRFDEADFKRVKKQYKENLVQQKSNPNYSASVAFASLLYGNNNIWGLNPTKKNIEKMELADLKGYYEKNYSPSSARVVIVGDVDQNEILSKLEFLNKWQPKDVKVYPAVTPAPIDPVVYLVDKIGAPSSIIRMGQLSLPYDATGEYFKNTVANHVLGGNFNSRLNMNLREEKGYTYGIRSGFNGDKYKGTFFIGTAVKRKETGNSMVEIIKETKNYILNGVTDAEVDYTKNSMLNGQAMNYETNFDKAFFLGNILEYNLSKDYPLQQAQILKSMTKEDFNNQIKKAYDPSKMAILIVGDKVAIKQQMESLNFNVKDFNDKLNLKKFKELDVD
ncbi:MAG: insulinase family protein, partial [Bacteroidia bacterium]|nr:insulinase family protein [Bacteroidia bacterium]